MNKITVEVDNFESEKIIEEVAKRVAARIYGDIEARLIKSTERNLDEMVKAKAEIKVIEILSKPVVETDSYGNPRGKSAKTMAEMLGEKFEKFLSERVDNYGHSGYGDRSKPRIDWLIDNIIDKGLKQKIEAEIAAARARTELQIGTVVAKMFAEAASKTK